MGNYIVNSHCAVPHMVDLSKACLSFDCKQNIQHAGHYLAYAGLMTPADRMKQIATEKLGKPRGAQIYIAKSCGITPQAVSAWFTGSTKQPTAENMASFSINEGVSLRWIATGTGEKYARAASTPEEDSAVEILRQLSPQLRAVALKQLAALLERPEVH